MKIEFDVTLQQKDMYRFSMHHAYSGTHGITSIIIAILIFLIAGNTYGEIEWTYTALYVVFGIVFLFYMPCNLYLRAKKQLLSSEVFKHPLHYTISESGIETSQNDAKAELPWEQVYKLVSTKHNILVYSNRVNAYVIPREQIGDNYAKLKEIAGAHLEKYRFKLK